MNCATSQAELQNDVTHARQAVEAIATAMEQLANVNYVAKGLLAGHAIVDQRTKRVFVAAKGCYESKKVQVTFNMQSVKDVALEDITAAHIVELYKGTPKAIFDMQKLIGEAAHVVAFDALNLWSSPFLDLNDLRETAEQANGY